jgi:hypothetical protein
MRRWAFVICGLGLMVTSGAEGAEGAEGGLSAEVEARPPVWNLGVEVVYGGLGGLGLGGLGGSAAAGLSLERHLAGPLWLRTRAGAHLGRYESGDDRHTSTGGYGALGLRVALAEVGPLGVSAFAEGHVAGRRARYVGPDVDNQSRALTMGGLAGVAGEVALTEVVALRSELGLLQAAWSRVWVPGEGERRDAHQLGFDLVPSVQLRLRL